MHDINFKLVKAQQEAKSYRQSFILWPTRWREFNKKVKAKFVWQVFPLKRAAAPKIPDIPGIYSFIVQPAIADHPHCSFLMYVGMTGKQTLRDRFGQYLGQEQGPKGRPHIIHLMSLYRQNLVFCCSPVPAGMTAAEAEDALLAAYIPPYCKDLPAEVSRIIGGLR